MSSIPEMLFKALGGFGITQYQKNRLKKKALNDGDLVDLIPCALKESGVFGEQAGLIAITNNSVTFGQTGKTTRLAFKLYKSWFQKFPLSILSQIYSERKNYYFGAVKTIQFKFSYNGKNYTLIFNLKNGEKFNNHVNSY